MIFEEILSRVKRETGIKNISELANFLGTTQPYVSKKKSQDDFSVKWAYQIAIEYGLSTEWIMTGKGPKKLGATISLSNEYLLLLEEWLNELKLNDPRKEYWFQCTIEEAFPVFKEWMRRKKSADQYRRIPETVA
ncbi:helix-turn-helix domain-containing protein [Candidatus Electronema sp. JM]|uniref:helix-turn-helix domain-containing protein n=1 Tax=Candidatus Electronema sp. JM TaxID=3401571 RepID=UPI003AA9D781